MTSARSLHPEEVLLQKLLKEPEFPAMLLDDQYRILASHGSYQEYTRLPENAGKRHCYEISHGFSHSCDHYGVFCPLKAAMLSGKSERGLHIHTSSRGREYVDVQVHPVTDFSGRRRFLEVIRPVSLASPEPLPAGLVGSSPAFLHMLDLLVCAARQPYPILLSGESGTGKELVARAIHESGDRANGPFVPVECAGLVPTLFESEMFGHKRGAFTGAFADKKGLLDAAHGGTLFLDEVSEIPLPLQVKLLRVLESFSYRLVGSTEFRQTDFRLICATNRNLHSSVVAGSFRQDIYYRITAFPITLPPLRERRGDIPLLVQALLTRISRRRMFIQAEAMTSLESYRFPGNVRELQNLLERACAMASGDTLTLQHFPDLHGPPEDLLCPDCRHAETSWPGMRPGEILPLEEMERRYLRYALAVHRGSRADLAQQLGIGLRTLFRKLQDMGDTGKIPES